MTKSTDYTTSDLETEHFTKEMISQRKSLLTSLFYVSLNNREMNFQAVRGLLGVFVAENITDMLIGQLTRLDDKFELEPKSGPNYCSGSLLTVNHSTPSVLCYCGRRFNRRYKSLKATWTIPRHTTHQKERAKS